jgi:hypothetical protein
MNSILFGVLLLQIKHYTANALTVEQVGRIKNFIISLEDKAIDGAVKHQHTADLIKSLAHGLSSTTIDWIIKSLLLYVRVPG